MPHRILVVEDDAGILGYCKTALESAGFEVETCVTAADARRLYAGRRPDLAVLDIGLPDGTGLDLLTEWKKLPDAPPPILFLTASGDMRTRLECFQKGAQDYVSKPFAVEELLARVKVHLQVKKSHDDLIRRNYELELVSRARQDMADMIVHDLKTPLTSIQGTLELIQEHGLLSAKDVAGLVANAGAATDFMLLMLNDLLDVSRSQQTALKAEFHALDLPLLFEKLRMLFAGRVQSRKVRLDLIVEPGAALRSDQNLVYRILANLIANAMKASKPGGTVEVVCGSDGTKVRLTVADRGPGVPDADKQKIFEKYTTTGRARAWTDTGSGLGLAFCRLAAQAIKGRVWVENRAGGGSLFVLEAPAQ
jgi:two-component system sensor histidine kinase/response regulator